MDELENKTSNHFDDIAHVWENKVWVNSHDFDTLILEFAELKGNEIGVDCGIGTGALAKKFNVKEMLGLDISKGMMASVEFPKQRLIVGSALDMPFLDNSFDFITGRNLLKHTNKPLQILKEMNRVLKPGGKLLIIESTPLQKEHTDIPTEVVRIVEPYHPPFISKEELLSLIEEANFKNIQSVVKIFKKKWLDGWCKAKKATEAQRDEIFELYKNAPDSFKKGQNVELFEEEKEILNDFPWTIVKAFK